MWGVTATLSMRPEGMAVGQRLLVEDVQDRAAELPGAQRADQRRLVDDRAPRDVDQPRRRASSPRARRRRSGRASTARSGTVTTAKSAGARAVRMAVDAVDSRGAGHGLGRSG